MLVFKGQKIDLNFCKIDIFKKIFSLFFYENMQESLSIMNKAALRLCITEISKEFRRKITLIFLHENWKNTKKHKKFTFIKILIQCLQHCFQLDFIEKTCFYLNQIEFKMHPLIKIKFCSFKIFENWKNKKKTFYNLVQ
jgi:hypothetical protein